MNEIKLELEKHKKRIKDLEFRVNSKEEKYRATAEIVHWKNTNEYCYTVVSWKYSDEGYNLHFIGNRFLSVDLETFLILLVYGQKYLDSKYNQENFDYEEYKKLFADFDSNIIAILSSTEQKLRELFYEKLQLLECEKEK